MEPLADERVHGKVASLISSRELTINRGSRHGVEIGMKFAVLDPAIGDVRDPDTGEVLGTLKREKVRVEVVSVEDKFCVARSYEQVRRGSSSLGGVAAFLQATAGAGAPYRTKTFEERDAEWKHLDEARSYVKVGDPVEEIVQSQSEPEDGALEEGSAT